ncbi:receptor-like protein kinase FERONIA [Gossypium australe]|uniref:Receptor-like protein kinase FERONIA n=1 Tax=Gossypium australe TaxID=47621 RepID=A0A5B6W6Q5_9ROSI|nr:receptor-like protein kinase FERONIA [Gossypium australe]
MDDQSEHMIQILEDMLRCCVLEFEGSVTVSNLVDESNEFSSSTFNLLEALGWIGKVRADSAILQVTNMSSESFSPPPPSVFAGENYHIWVVKMKTYLQAFDLWEVVDADWEPLP